MPVSKPLKARPPSAGVDDEPGLGRVRAGQLNPTGDLTNKVEAINRALQSWNDQEVLRLLRMHWREIARFVRERAKA